MRKGHDIPWLIFSAYLGFCGLFVIYLGCYAENIPLVLLGLYLGVLSYWAFSLEI
jgi:hypothetical protein